MKNKKLLVVVDMQNDFITGSLRNEDAIAIVGNVVAKVKAAAADKDEIIFTRDTHQPNYLDTLEGKNLPVKHCIEGTDGWQIIPELKDFAMKAEVIDKKTFGFDGWNYLLLGNSYSEIELCGVCTDICVVSNALMLRASFPNTKIMVDSSCCAGVTKEKHEAALEVMKSCQISVY